MNIREIMIRRKNELEKERVRLERELAGPGDIKAAKDLSAILKDMTALALQLQGQEGREVTVRFLGAAEDASV